MGLISAFEDVGVDPFFEIEAYYDIAERYMDHARQKAERRARCFEDIAERKGRNPELGRKIAMAYEEYVDYGNVRPLEGMAEVFDAFADEYRMGVVTNGEPTMQDPKLDAIGVVEHVDVVVYAGIQTAAKPDPEPYEVALSELESDPAEAVIEIRAHTPAFP